MKNPLPIFKHYLNANEYARMTQPATKALGVLLTGAAWMGKGPRPAVRVQVPVIVTQPPVAAPTEAKDTAKGKIIEEPMPKPEPGPGPVPVVSEPPQQQQRAFSLAVNAVPLEEPAMRPMPMAAEEKR